MLTTRLRELEVSGLVRKVELPPPANVDVYELTDWARDLQPILQGLGQWAQASPTRNTQGAGLTPDATVQAMQTMAPQTTVDPPIELQLRLFDARLDDDRGYDYSLSWGENGLRIERGTNHSAVATVTADSTAWVGALLESQMGSMNATIIDGDQTAVSRLLDKFQSIGAASP